MIKTGIGYDVHQLAEGEKLIIGGVEIPSQVGAIGHSDGDTLVHAIVDALLGAANLGDIGQLFPSKDEQWKDIESLHFFNKVAEMLRNPLLKSVILIQLLFFRNQYFPVLFLK
ncbi:MAG: hypothetical protein Ct9H300mP29_1070 [Candidatus Neomarinimicrobiota bacterium]|nr:MAG: hypothetical protein Ct9H300mP29_1070 [Candidatus Neomarinimicrobiota bacterium]